MKIFNSGHAQPIYVVEILILVRSLLCCCIEPSRVIFGCSRLPRVQVPLGLAGGVVRGVQEATDARDRAQMWIVVRNFQILRTPSGVDENSLIAWVEVAKGKAAPDSLDYG